MEDPFVLNADKREDSALGEDHDDLAELEECALLIPDDRKIAMARRSTLVLLIATFLCGLFMVGEFIGGYIANSIAVYSDALHMLSDLTGFLINIAGIRLSMRMPSYRWTFGYQRVEIVAAICSILIIWAMTAVLCYEAGNRVINPKDVNGKVMILVGGIGIFMNIILGAVLYQGGVAHSHFGKECHGHGHGETSVNDSNASNSVIHSHSQKKTSCSHGHSHTHDHGHSHDKGKGRKVAANISVQSAFVHALGDLLQNVGVLIAGVMITIDHEKYRVMDPICTFVFSAFVLLITGPVLKNAFYVLMETVPPELDPRTLKHKIRSMRNVKHLKDFHVWCIGYNEVALVAKVEVGEDVLSETSETSSCQGHCDLRQCCKRAIKELARENGVTHCTVEVELQCMSPKKKCSGGPSCGITVETKPNPEEEDTTPLMDTKTDHQANISIHEVKVETKHGHSHSHGHGHAHEHGHGHSHG